MTGGLSVVAPGSPVQLSLALLTMVTLLLVTLKLAPFANAMDDTVAFLSSMSLSLTTFGGLVLIMDKPKPLNAFNPMMVGIGIIAVNVAVVVVNIGNIIMVECGLYKRAQKLVRTLTQGKRSGLGHKKGDVRVVPIRGGGGGGVQAWDQPSHHEFETMKKEKLELEKRLLASEQKNEDAANKAWE